MKKMKWEVTIAEVDNGYVVRVGCKLFVFELWSTLMGELNCYAKGEKTNLSESVLKEMETVQPTAPSEQPEQPCGSRMPQSITDNLARP